MLRKESYLKYFLFCLLLGGISLIIPSANAQTVNQQHLIRGAVTDESGEALIGATVRIKGSNSATVTDLDGAFSIQAATTDLLIVSYVGFEPIEVVPQPQKVMSIVLKENNILDEVVVVGYGTMKKSDLTGAVTSIGGDMIGNKQSTQVSQALQGAISGVMVTRNNSAPGASSTIRVRGITTLSDNDPLVIVDGVPLLGINDINPSDVENITVLKDAASASIYGARAAAGVILITTKRAKSGKPSLRYNVELGFTKPTVMSRYADAQRYMEMVNELRWNDNGNISGAENVVYTAETINNYRSLHLQNPDLYPNTDWTDLILKNTAPTQKHSLSISAGNDVIQSNVSLGYDNVDGLYHGKKYERITARFNNDVNIAKYLSSTVDFYIKRSLYNDPSVNPIGEMRKFPAIYSAIWSNGLISEGKGGQNIYARLKYGGYDKKTYNQYGGKASLKFSPLKGLDFSFVVSALVNNNKEKLVRNSIQYTAYDNPNIIIGYISNAATNNLTENRPDSYRLTTQLIANYKKTLKQHNVSLMAGFESYKAYSESMSGYSNNMQLSTYPYLDLANNNFISVNGNAHENAYNSYFGRFVYSYKNRYLVQGNFRYDGSSRFSSDNRWGFFPSFSAGWVLSEEAFMKKVEILSFLKLRASWGRLGNERIGDYPYQSSINFGNALFYSGNTVGSFQTGRQEVYAMENLTWETTESINIGIDVNFFNNKLQVSGDYYKKKTRDMLLKLDIPDYGGFKDPSQNAGKMHTRGWDMEVRWNDKIGDLKYSISANLSDFKSIMGNLSGVEFLGDQIKIEGSEFNEWYGYKTDGIFQTQEEIDNYPTLNANVKPGDIKLLDISGPDGVPDGIISADYDRTLLGGSLPRYMYGMNINLEYKNLDLSLLFQGVGKQNSHKTTVMVQPLQSDYGNFPDFIDGNYWSVYNTPEKNASVHYPRLSATSSKNNYAMSDYWLFNGAYFRMKNITLGYTFPSSWTEKIRLKGIRLYMSASDLFSLNKYPKGWDPEVSDTGYPITASFIFGASINF